MLDVVIPVHNGAATIARSLAGVLSQHGSGQIWGNIIVVDDASTDDTANIVSVMRDPRLCLIRRTQRGGRGPACNTGAAGSDAEFLLFLDSDCRPRHQDLLQRHALALRGGADVSFGRIEGEGMPFWEYLAAEVAREREESLASGSFLGMTSCNIAISRACFERVGGFYGEYRQYGFEDRDLLASLERIGCTFAFDRDAVVTHAVDTSCFDLCAKMEQSGGSTAPIFRRRHPQLYRRMKFAQVDVHTGSLAVRALFPMLTALYPGLRWLAECMTSGRWWPYRWRVIALRTAMAVAYLRGTASERSSMRTTGP